MVSSSHSLSLRYGIPVSQETGLAQSGTPRIRLCQSASVAPLRGKRAALRGWASPFSLVRRCEPGPVRRRSEEHTSELQSLMRISYAVFCLKKKKNKEDTHIQTSTQLNENLVTQHNLTMI